MSDNITGLDRYKLEGIATKLYNIDLSKWMCPLNLFETNLIKYHNKVD